VKIGAMGLLLLNTSLFVGCSADKKDDIPVVENGETVLKLSVPEIEDNLVAESQVSGQQASTKASTGLTSSSGTRAQEQMLSTGEFDVLLSADGPFSSAGTAKKASANQYSAMAVTSEDASVAMVSGTKYILQVYDAKGTTLIKEVEGTVGSDPQITVDGGTTYQWKAFSINEKNVPTSTGGQITAADIINKDVLYASGSLDTKTGQNYLKIVFKHMTARFDIELDTRGIFGSISSLSSAQIGTGTGSSFKSILKIGDFNLSTGTFGTLSAIAADKTGLNMVDKDAVATGTVVKNVSIYTVIPAEDKIAAGKLVFQPIFSISLDHQIAVPPSTASVSTRKYGSTATYLALANPEFTPVTNGKYTLKARFIESPVKVGGISWARSDLWYDGTSGQIDRYRFKADAGIPPYDSDNQNEYWNWKSLTPAGTAGAGDPCSRVYPTGIWRMPTTEEMVNLGNRSSYEYYGFPVSGNGNQYADAYFWFLVANQSWNKDSGSSSGQGDFSGYSDKVIFTFNGYRQSGTIVNSRKKVDMHITSSYTTDLSMGYWTGDASGSNAVSMVQNASVSYNRPYNYVTAYGGRSMKYYSKSLGFNVRCVRN